MSKLTTTQLSALREYRAAGPFIVPPACQGQAVEVSYGCTEDAIYRRVLDRSDRSLEIVAYRHPVSDREWAPWNGEPVLGARIGRLYKGPLFDAPQA